MEKEPSRSCRTSLPGVWTASSNPASTAVRQAARTSTRSASAIPGASGPRSPARTPADAESSLSDPLLDRGRGTVGRWRTRFLRDRLDGLADEPRPGVPRTITDARVEEVVVRTREQTPPAGTHWSKRELAKVMGISPASVLRIWHAFGLQPWRTETFKISPDPFLIDKVRDVVGLYPAPPANAVVFAGGAGRRSRPFSEPHRSCRWPRECPSDGVPTTPATAPSTCSQR
ncbi:MULTISPECIES: helix-turn-helix domain-containing protein [Streptomyces]|uniref:helix-turn-helix domain-containing protein n=1 Tax=Streptomyces TaxID=1883 RepID=UPI00211D688B|nr:MULTISPECIES: helix-turn-helix domain-containing protein [unclassified Streptomyces]